MSDKIGNHQQSRSVVKKKRDADYLPDHICETFEKELCDLIVRVAPNHGFKGEYLLSEFKSKYLDSELVSPESRRTAAISKWLSSEARNCKTNQRLQLGKQSFGYVTYDRFMAFYRELIRKILGPLKYPMCLYNGYHTNGASSRIRRSAVAAVEKHTGIAHVSSSALKHWLATASSTRLSDQALGLQENSVLFTVPKKTDIDRVACKEPEINMFLQRQVGSHIRTRLKRFGINLDDQSKNQELAKIGYCSNLATIDLSAASDSISRQLVFESLPFEWWSLLDDLRVHHVDIDGDLHFMEMFSTMGNGFTFELESMLFYCLCRTIAYFSGVKGEISVYGDDIIVPCALAPRVRQTFLWFGFEVNTKKSAWKGKFRESCGKHYFAGIDVTPFYLREKVRKKSDVIRLLNRLLLWDGGELRCLLDTDILSFHKKWVPIIPKSLHGGVDPEDSTALVTGDRPRKRLARATKSIPVNQAAKLDYWFTRRESLRSDLEVGVDRSTHSIIVDYKCADWQLNTAWDPYLLTR